VGAGPGSGIRSGRGDDPGAGAAAPVRRLCVIGVGLIGGSFARALRAAGACAEIVGCGRDAAHLERARALGVIDRAEVDPARAVVDADVVMLAAPVGASGALLQAVAPVLRDDALISDAGSVKGSVLAAARAALGGRFPAFVPGHPIAGTERSGVEASSVDLFRGRCTVLTPTAETDARALARVRGLWEACGARVVEMDAAHHDRVFAAVSHLPHLLAYTLVDWIAARPDAAELFDFAGGGFRDFTRIASSDPVMWRDICTANAEALGAQLAEFAAALDAVLRAVRAGDAAALEALFARAKRARDRKVEAER